MHLRMFLCNQNPEMQKPLVATVQELCKMLVVRLCTKPVDQRSGIILALLLIVLAFLNIFQQWRGSKMRPIVINSPSTHYYTYWKYTGRSRITDTSAGPNGIRRVSLYDIG